MPTLPMCLVTGSIKTVADRVPSDTKIVFRPVSFPILIEGVIVTADAVKTVPDVNGDFAVNLVQGSTVIVEIERTGIRHQIVIPEEETAVLTDLLPPPLISF